METNRGFTKIALAVLMIHISTKLYKESVPEGSKNHHLFAYKTTSGFLYFGHVDQSGCVRPCEFLKSRPSYRSLTRGSTNTYIPFLGIFALLGRRWPNRKRWRPNLPLQGFWNYCWFPLKVTCGCWQGCRFWQGTPNRVNNDFLFSFFLRLRFLWTRKGDL